MASPVVLVNPRRAPQLDAQDHERLHQQSPGLEVRKQSTHRLVQDRALPQGPLEVVAVGVPRPPSIRLPRTTSVWCSIAPALGSPRSCRCGFATSSPHDPSPGQQALYPQSPARRCR